ncbi:hypothetical protein Dda_7615 [Drechslerella dactyloides]|uniref:Signal recognition particle, SRP9/SRP14 subunit n=1 Tax=Drechslerella dactyloides TaxID=74499 RepID=A0AAD6IT09_DREDA|nr:hypothetical protein Dda_7615 [Drechslerella dactyloides]
MSGPAGVEKGPWIRLPDAEEMCVSYYAPVAPQSSPADRQTDAHYDRLSYDPAHPPPTKTIARPAKVTKPSTAAASKKKPTRTTSTFTKTTYPPSTADDLKADLLALLSSTASPSSSAAGTATASTGLTTPAPEDPAAPSPSLPVLIRATNGKSNDARHDGKHIKLSTVVEADQLEAFFTRYAEAWKQGLTALKKKVRKGKKSKKAKKK